MKKSQNSDGVNSATSGLQGNWKKLPDKVESLPADDRKIVLLETNLKSITDSNTNPKGAICVGKVRGRHPARGRHRSVNLTPSHYLQFGTRVFAFSANCGCCKAPLPNAKSELLPPQTSPSQLNRTMHLLSRILNSSIIKTQSDLVSPRFHPYIRPVSFAFISLIPFRSLARSRCRN